MNISGYAESNFRYGKDQVLQQYQYFVGTQDTGVKKTPLDTGISALRSGENFSL